MIPALVHTERRAADRWALALLSVVLAGYAFMGRGFAYLGLPPLFIGEITLGVCLLAALSAGRFFDVFRGVTPKLLLAFIVLGAVRTAYDVPTWGVDALRDAVIWGYGLFAFAVGAMLLRDPERLRLFFARYRRFIVGFLLVAGLLYLASRGREAALPRMPGTDMPIVEAKGGDMMVHLAGITAFLMVGLGRWRWWLFLALGANLALLAVTNRGGMVAYVLACGLVLVLRSRRVRIAMAAYAGILIVSAFVLIDPRIPLPSGREVSVEQFTENFRSVAGGSDKSALNNTKKWRLDWWSKIVRYTFAGPYFLAGKGFGVNLADDDGFQVVKGSALRSPHNGHLTILARMGVPGFLLWLALLGAWFLGNLRCLFRARGRGEEAWQGIFLFLLAYATAFLVNASFDVYLEGPMGGIWFWTVFGVGLAAPRIYARFERPAPIPTIA